MYRSGREVDYGDRSSLQYHGRGVPEDSGSGGKGKRRGGLFGIFRKNPSLMIILVDIIVIILVLTLVLPFIGIKSPSGTFLGLDLSLHGFVHEETATVSLVVTSLPGEAQLLPDERIRIRFVIPGGGDGAAAEIEAKVPPSGETEVLRAVIELEGTGDYSHVRAQISNGQENLTLQKELTREK